MTIQPKKNYPAYRVCFAARTGNEHAGKQEIGFPIEIGSAWPRQNGKPGHIIRLNLVPQDLRDGVIFLFPVDQAESPQTELPLEEVAS